MGIFNWASKGFNIEKREPTKAEGDAEFASDMTSVSTASAAVESDGFPDADSITQPVPLNPIPQSTISPNSITQNPLSLSEAPQAPQSVQGNLFDLNSQQPSASSLLFSSEEPPSSSQFNFNNQFSSAFSGATLGNRNILIVTPKSNADVTGIVDNLQHGEACIIRLDGLPTVDAQRRLDFLSGVICALNGQIKPLNESTYILTPSGLGVRN